MRKTRWIVLPVTLGVLTWAALAAGAAGGHEHSTTGGKAITVTGELVDLSCFLGHGAKGASHKECAATCIKKGLPMGVLTKDGKVYLLLEDHAKAATYASCKEKAAETVTVTGQPATKDGIKGLLVAEVK